MGFRSFPIFVNEQFVQYPFLGSQWSIGMATYPGANSVAFAAYVRSNEGFRERIEPSSGHGVGVADLRDHPGERDPIFIGRYSYPFDAESL